MTILSINSYFYFNFNLLEHSEFGSSWISVFLIFILLVEYQGDEISNKKKKTGTKPVMYYLEPLLQENPENFICFFVLFCFVFFSVDTPLSMKRKSSYHHKKKKGRNLGRLCFVHNYVYMHVSCFPVILRCQRS